jgi:carboxymethylenebutenolidase
LRLRLPSTPLPRARTLAGSKAAVLGIYAELDSRVNASRSAARAALRKAGLSHQIVTFPGVDHAFFNPTSSRHDPTAAAAAYRRLLAWFGHARSDLEVDAGLGAP